MDCLWGFPLTLCLVLCYTSWFSHTVSYYCCGILTLDLLNCFEIFRCQWENEKFCSIKLNKNIAKRKVLINDASIEYSNAKLGDTPPLMSTVCHGFWDMHWNNWRKRVVYDWIKFGSMLLKQFEGEDILGNKIYYRPREIHMNHFC